jgi:hypothetical protein
MGGKMFSSMVKAKRLSEVKFGNSNIFILSSPCCDLACRYKGLHKYNWEYQKFSKCDFVKMMSSSRYYCNP